MVRKIVRSGRSHLKRELEQFLDENGLEPCEDNQLVLKRTFTSAGTNRQFINGSATALATLARIGEWLVDMHGRRTTTSLAPLLRIPPNSSAPSRGRLQCAGERPRGFKANWFAAVPPLENEKIPHSSWTKKRMHNNSTCCASRSGRFPPRCTCNPGEDEQVEAGFHRASNAARLLQLSQAALELLSESDNSLLTQSGAVGPRAGRPSAGGFRRGQFG